MKKRIRPGTVLYWSAAIIWFLAAAFPLYFTFISSFKDNSQIFSAFLIPSLRPVFDNYVMAQKMAGILKATANSLFVSGSAIAIMLLFCTMGTMALCMGIIRAAINRPETADAKGTLFLAVT